ncbi:helix-turn-helix transcriptional regulator [Haloarchaeobius amylolyticus]|uniref:Helix-turn-helix transcriptional regulator n=1 Tax=Haloarchaeobius amylolyticus TaxID=1198296 RepID=A0ABD6BKJ2_9EURY
MEVKGLRALVCLLVVVACSGVLAPVAPATADAGTQPVLRQVQADDGGTDTNGTVQLEDADRIHIDVAIAENGSAQVTTDYQFYPDDNGSMAEWESLDANITNNTAWYIAEERRGWNETLTEGENATDREMNISNVSIETEMDSQPEEIGHAKVTFQWSEFAHVEVNQIEAGAALSGFTLSNETTLQFRWPEPYTVYETEDGPQVTPSPDERSNRSVTWEGETNFPDDQPRLVLMKNGDSATTQPSADGGPAMPWVVVVLALALLATVAVAGWLRSRNRARTGGTDGGTDTAWRTDGAAEPDSSAAQTPPPELLSNEERVLRLLEQRGGRIKQQEVVSELDWTEAKTSQVVGELRENDEIEVFRIGRENVLSLPDDE